MRAVSRMVEVIEPRYYINWVVMFSIRQQPERNIRNGKNVENPTGSESMASM